MATYEELLSQVISVAEGRFVESRERSLLQSGNNLDLTAQDITHFIQAARDIAVLQQAKPPAIADLLGATDVANGVDASSDIDALLLAAQQIRDRNINGIPIIFTSATLGAGEYQGYFDHSTGTRQVVRASNGAVVADAVFVRFAVSPAAPTSVYSETYRLSSRIASATAAAPERLAVTGGPSAATGTAGNTLAIPSPTTLRGIYMVESPGAQYGGMVFVGASPGLGYLLGQGRDFVGSLPQIDLGPNETLAQTPSYEVSAGVSGFGTPGNTIELFLNSVSQGTTVVGSDRSWQFRQRGLIAANDALFTATEAGSAITGFEISHAEVEITLIRRL